MRTKNIISIIVVLEILFLLITMYPQVKAYNSDILRLQPTIPPYSAAIEEIVMEEEAIVAKKKPLYFIPFQENNLCGSLKAKVLHFNSGTNKVTDKQSLKASIDENGRVNLSLKKIRKLESIKGISASCPVRTLDLSYNGLLSIPSNFGDLPDLEHLIYSDNFITALTGIHLPNDLKSLDVSSNDITTIFHSFFNLKELEYLDLSANFNLVNIPSNIQNLTNLKDLNISQTLLAKDKKKVEMLQALLPNTTIKAKG